MTVTQRIVLDRITQAGPAGLTLDDLLVSVGQPAASTKGALLILGDKGLIEWDEHEPRRVHLRTVSVASRA